MSNNLENERSVGTSKMYPIDLAPQTITIVKSVPNSEVKMTHLVPGPAITTGAGQIITHTGSLGLMRPSTQIISSSVSSQPHMIVSSSPLLQGSQMLSQGSQMISKTQLLSSNTHIVSPGTQIISQGSQLSAQLGNNSSGPSCTGPGGAQVGASSSGSQVLNVGGLVSGTGGLVVSSTVRTLPPSVRVLPPLPHHNARPVLSSVSLSTSNVGIGGAVGGKTLTSHVPRGPGIAASLAVPRVAARPITPVSQTMPISSLGTAWSSGARGVRGAVVYTRAPRPAPPRAAPPPDPLTNIVTLPSTNVLTSSSVITGMRAVAPPRPSSAPVPVQPAPRPVPLVQRNYQPAAKLVGVASVGVRTPVGNSAPAQLYYEVPRPAPPHPPHPPHPFHLNTTSVHSSVNVVNAVRASPESRAPPPAPAAPVPSAAVALTAPPRPSILRKRDVDESPTKQPAPIDYPPAPGADTLWEEGIGGAAAGGGGGSTTESAASSPAPEDDPASPPLPPRDTMTLPLAPLAPAPPHLHDISPRKKPRKQLLTTEVRQCEFTPEEPATPPPVPSKPPPKRPQLRSQFVCGWRATALHFVRPADVRRRDPRPRDILAIASQRHVLAHADGWKVHHLTQQMSDLVSLESDVGSQLTHVLRTLESAHGKAQSALQPHSHALLELVKGNIQRSRIVCEGVQEAREDILRVFTHRNFVADIISRQADKRCFRKHRSQS